MSNSKPAKWLQLENYVASIFRSLGYHVERDLLIEGNQVDIRASKRVPGYGLVSSLVEVKYRSGRSLPKDEVLSFLHVAHPLLQSGQFTKAILVTNASFTKEGKAAVDRQQNIELLTLSELERSFLSVDEQLLRYLTTYRQQPINATFLDLTVSLRDSYPPDDQAPRTLHCSELWDVARARPDSALILFADYGGGKTTALERMKAIAAEQFLSGASEIVPMLFLLREFEPDYDFEIYIQRTFEREFGVGIPAIVFWDLLESGRFGFLLDGFDEITLRADRNTRADLLRKISPLLFGPCPAVLSSRPSYFVNAEEYLRSLEELRNAHNLQLGTPHAPYTKLSEPNVALSSFVDSLRRRYQRPDLARQRKPAYVVYAIELLTAEQIADYLSRSSSLFEEAGIGDWRAVLDFVMSVYDLSDLTTRPILLDTIVATVLAGVINVRDRSIAFGPSDLYEAYTSLKLQLDWDKATSRRMFLSPAARQEFAEECAIAMQKQRLAELAETAVHAIAQRGTHSPDVSLERLMTDLRTCSFLTVTRDGALRFVHRSFQEFFCARRIKRDLDMRVFDTLEEQLPQEIVYFLGGFAVSDEAFRERLCANIAAISSGSTGIPRDLGKVIAANMASALLYSSSELAGLRWRSIDVRFRGAAAKTIAFSTLEGVRFSISSVEQWTFEDCRFDGIEIVSDETSVLNVTRCVGQLRILGSLGTMRFTSSTMSVSVDSSAIAVAVSGSSLRLELSQSTALEISLVECREPSILLVRDENRGRQLGQRTQDGSVRVQSLRSRLDVSRVGSLVLAPSHIKESVLVVGEVQLSEWPVAISQSIVVVRAESIGRVAGPSSQDERAVESERRADQEANLSFDRSILVADARVARSRVPSFTVILGGSVPSRVSDGRAGVCFLYEKRYDDKGTELSWCVVDSSSKPIVIRGGGASYEAVQQNWNDVIDEVIRRTRRGSVAALAAGIERFLRAEGCSPGSAALLEAEIQDVGKGFDDSY